MLFVCTYLGLRAASAGGGPVPIYAPTYIIADIYWAYYALGPLHSEQNWLNPRQIMRKQLDLLFFASSMTFATMAGVKPRVLNFAGLIYTAARIGHNLNDIFFGDDPLALDQQLFRNIKVKNMLERLLVMAATITSTSHGELIGALSELYTLLLSLGAVSTDQVCLPDSSTGIHPDGALNTEAAEAAGYASETIGLMNLLPYLAVDRHEMFLELLPNTFPITYIGEDLDEGYFLDRRELLNDAEMPSTALRLTRSEIYGTEFIYDIATKLLTPWKPIDNPDEVDDYSHVTGVPPREVLFPIIEDYRKLRYLATPRGVDFSPPDFANSRGVPPSGWSVEEQRRWKASYAVWDATQKLRDFYLECGWDVDAVEQKSFNLDEFLARRETYWREVVEPLLRTEEETSQ
ncbi:hypothetical protein O1611_g1194 [Lasiodiplodia mahajangana]|uniref:Uncharacterized protein n=1 Tax=Lasiodiplodia mahajangana TaxID=1108764 RepID=A0ACC2JYD2_9PEZI|nr:hypothetical protein O1611_g1194 [Lasiodiplodia mahajangana]